MTSCCFICRQNVILIQINKTVFFFLKKVLLLNKVPSFQDSDILNCDWCVWTEGMLSSSVSPNDKSREAQRVLHASHHSQTVSCLHAVSCCLPTVNWPFHPVLICEEQCQACVASCLLQILYVQPQKEKHSVQREVIHVTEIFSFSSEAK